MTVVARLFAPFLVLYLFALGSGHAASFQNKEQEQAFRAGSLRLTSSLMGKGIGGGAALHQLYIDKRWEELVEQVVSKRFVSDLYYFYLARAAEELNHVPAALLYYELAVANHNAGNSCTRGFDSCRGIPIAQELNMRTNNLRNTARDGEKAVLVVSRSGEPIAGVTVTAVKSEGSACATDSAGACVLKTRLPPLDAVDITLTKARYFPGSARIAPDAPEHRAVMLPFRSLFCKELLADGMSALADKIEAQVAMIFSRALLDNARAQEVCVSEFKKRRYMSVRLANDLAFNENKLTSYAIGAIVFDDVAKKMLLQLSTSAASFNLDGYDIAVTGSKHTFGEQSGLAKPVNFRFYFPKPLVDQYIDKDISGQQLLDGSVILLNDDRVDLKLN